METSKLMKFSKDAIYNGEVVANAGDTVRIPGNMVERWMKRGAVIVDEPKDEAAKNDEEVLDAPDVDDEEVEGTDKKEDDQKSNKRRGRK